MKGRRYRTDNRDAIVNWFMAHEGAPISVAALKARLEAEGRGMSIATLYRNLALLSDDGWLTRTGDAVLGSDVYVYRKGPDGFMLHCLGCGKMESHHCSQAEALWRHIAESHHFLIDRQQVIIRGYCRECQDKHRSQTTTF
ncbi:MAG: Fur family transcriptional regulator [Peptococcus niger]